MNAKEIRIGEDTVNYLESLDYELTSRRSIISYMLDNNMNTDTDAFRQYQQEHVEYTAKFNIAKKELERAHIPAGFKGSWSLDYGTGVLTLTERSSEGVANA